MSNKNMLIIDDKTINRSILRHVFECEFNIIEASDGLDALKKIEGQNISIIITDIFMTPMSGYDFIQSIRKIPEYKSTPIIAITENDGASQRKAMEVGANEFLVRPFGAFALRCRVENILSTPKKEFQAVDFDSFFKAIPGGVAIYEIESDYLKLIYCSEGVPKLSGLNFNQFYDLADKHFHNQVYPNEEMRIRNALLKCINENVDGDLICRIRHKDNYPIWVRFKCHLLGIKNGHHLVQTIFINVSKETLLYRAILDQADFSILVVNTETHGIIYANKKAEIFSGKENQDNTSLKCYQYLFDSESPCQYCKKKGFERADLISDFEKNGKHFRIMSSPIIWEGQKAEIDYIYDITLERKTRDLISASNSFLSNIISNIKTGIAIFDIHDGEIFIKEINTECLHMLNFTSKPTSGTLFKNCEARFRPSEANTIKNIITDLHSSQEYTEASMEYLDKKTGKLSFFLVKGIASKDYQGETIYYISLTDITRQHELKILQKNQAEKYKLLYENVNCSIFEFILNNDNKIKYLSLNKTALKMASCSLEKAVDGNFHRLTSFVVNDSDDAFNRLKNSELNTRISTTLKIRNGMKEEFWVTGNLQYTRQTDEGKVIQAVLFDISERKRIEEALDKQTKQLSLALKGVEDKNNILDAAVKNTSLYYWEVDMDLREAFFGERIRREYKVERILYNYPDSWLALGFIHPEDIEAHRKNINLVLETRKKNITWDSRIIIPKTKKYMWLRITMTAIPYIKGLHRKAVITAENIDYEKHLESLYIDEQTNRRTLDADIIQACRIDLTKGKVLEINLRNGSTITKKISALTDFRKRISISFKDCQLSDEQNAQMSFGYLTDLYSKGNRSTSIEFQATHQEDNKVYWIKTEVKMMINTEEGHLIAFYYLRDRTEQHKNELAKQIFTRDMNAMTNSINFVFQFSSRINFDKNTCNILKYSNIFPLADNTYNYNDFLDKCQNGYFMNTDSGKKYYETFNAEKILTEYRNGKNNFSLTHTLTYLDGSEHWFQTTLIVFPDTITKDLLGFCSSQNIDAIKEAEDMAIKANASKTDFLARMSHDIRTPLNAILGLTTLSLDDKSLSKPILENLNNIQKSGQFLLELVNDILDMSKIESGKLTLNETINDYDDFINTLETIFHQSCAAKNINFDFRKDNLNKIIKVDRLRLNQIFFNILSNSIKFTPEGGTVSFRTDNLQLFPTYFEEDLIIQDTGIGMSEAFMKHLFHPFEQEDTSYSSNLKGTGLGLSIAKTLVELMGGTIKIESKQNIGTTVLIHLAFKLATEAEIRKTGSLKQINYDETKLQNRHILLAEDHPLNAQIAIKLLEKKGIIVTHCENGQAAVEAFKKSEPDYFDIILMDIRMPIMDGLEATKEIRKLDHPNSKTIPIIAMTANAYDEDINQTRDAGMNYHLSKPIQTDLLYQTLIKALKK